MELLRLPDKGVTVYGCAIGDVACLADERKAVGELLEEAFAWKGCAVSLGHTESGAPYVAGLPESISVTHCRGLAALAVCANECRVGIDAEASSRGAQLRRVAGKFLSGEQQLQWGGADASLLRAWTIKEALYKGAGIAGLPLKEIPLAMPEALGGSMGQNKVSVRGGTFGLYDVEIPWFDGLVTLAVENLEPGKGLFP